MSFNLIENAIQFRIARPTNQLAAIKIFYIEGLGFKEIGSFTEHEGYSGIMLGFPNSQYHLEFTTHKDGEQLPPPTKENLLVLYFDTVEKYTKANERLLQMGINQVEPINPYWIDKSQTYEDPDKWRIVLFNGVYTHK
ncbi:VOC family protein [Mariniflexile sp.]|uniref:VOC family protein n=1 Tax=Mariniflexile sp. TaxID=1979402 RepID=UPI003564DF12